MASKSRKELRRLKRLLGLIEGKNTGDSEAQNQPDPQIGDADKNSKIPSKGNLEPVALLTGTLIIGAFFSVASFDWGVHPGLFLWITFAGLILIAYLVCFALQSHYKRTGHPASQAKRLFVISGSILLLFCLVIQLLIFTLRPAPSTPFKVDIKTVIANYKPPYQSGFWFTRQTKLGKTISPISIALTLQLTNLKGKQLTLETIGAEIRHGSGDWIKLTRVNAREGSVYLAFEDLMRASPLQDMPTYALDYIAQEPLQSDATIMGWLFFEIPRTISLPHVDMLEPQIAYRISVSDTTGTTWTHVIDRMPIPSGRNDDSVRKSGFYVPGFTEDLSHFVLWYYGDPIR